MDSFQRVQREAAEREREGLAAARGEQQWALAGPGEQEQQGQSRTQLMVEEEDRIQALQHREQGMRQLESDIVDVNTIFKVGHRDSVKLYRGELGVLYFHSYLIY